MRGAVEMRFKVGDKVRVLENLTLEDVGHVHDMLEFEGLEATVETVFDQSYHLTVDNHEWYWMDELLEPVEEELEMSNVKFDMPEWVNWLARDSNGALYAYREKPMKCSTVFGASEAYTAGDPNLHFITEDPNHYPQVKWSDEEPTAFKDGIILINPDELDEIHFYPSEEVSSGKSELDTNEAITALQSFGSSLTDNEKLRWGLKTVNEIREGYREPMKKYERHSEITKQLNEIYIAKNTDYGDAFGDTFKKLGIISAVTRIADKTNRLMSLSAKTEAERNVKDETIKDTLMDLANYAIMTLIEVEESE